jgi:uncharacterized protein
MRTRLGVPSRIIPVLATALVAASTAVFSSQAPAVRVLDPKVLHEYEGVYRWDTNGFLYVQLWNEFSGFDKPGELVSFDDSGSIRVLYPTGPDRFFSGPGAAVRTSAQSHIDFQRDRSGKVASLNWTAEGATPRTARRVDVERRDAVQFSNGDVHLSGTLVSPITGGKHPAIVLVHGSGAQNRESILPWARFLIRHGIALLGYDKRGVGESSGDWNTASFDDLAGDVVAAVEYLKKRDDIDPTQIGLLGISQAGWIMPLAATRVKHVAFVISLSGAGVPPSETTIDEARNEMTMTGMSRDLVDQIIALLKLQYEFARTGSGWSEYAAAREKLAAKMGPPPDTIPGTPDAPYFQFIRRLYFFDPIPVLKQLRTPTLAIWGELDNNIVADKNRAAWDASLGAGGNRDYTLTILPKANHALWQANTGTNAEMKSLQRFAPDYAKTIETWLAQRIRGYKSVE